MVDSNSVQNNKPATLQKKQGPIRWNAIIPFVIIMALIYGYFFFFFDSHMKKAIEWTGYKALGTELNIAHFKTSFLQGKVELTGLEITHAVQPQFNSIELSSIRFGVNWGALLRLKFVIDEIAVEGVQFMSKRSHPGKVAPPEPADDGKPSFAQQLSDKATNKLEKDNQSNVLSDVSIFLKTGKWDEQIKNLESQLASKKMLEEMNSKWTSKKTEWDAKVKMLPTSAELNGFKNRFESIKSKDFKTPQELDTSVKQFNALIKDVDSRNKQIQEIKIQLDADLKGLDQDYKSIDAQIKKDIDTLKTKFKIPKIDAASFAKSLFMSYLTPIMSKLDHYKNLAEKYLPPKYARKISGKKEDIAATEPETIQPHPRADGTTYEFPIPNGFPLFWIKKISLSSTSNKNADYGDFKGLIENITSNQRQINKTTTLDIAGSFKKMSISGVKINAELNNLKEEPQVNFGFNVGAFPITNMELLKSSDGEISIPQTTAAFQSAGQTIGFKNYDLKMKTDFSHVTFKTSATDPTVAEVLSKTLQAINQFNVEATATGELKDLKMDIRSSLGGDLQKAFENLLKEKIAEANEKLQLAVNTELDKLKRQLTGQTDAIKNQATGEVAKVQKQIDDQKKQVDERINLAKKDFEKQAQKGIQDAGQKALDDLKKKFGL
ncbi:MAG: hypothetical protein A2622_02160 [Bdellovibrionales bacterium RIFCSPHIGHO2_01_FULL_40_29]|nr:MAG: hypothetical protein A2622_02160 [Bdellovibrionales bacterium RIFCSPHIGHO2_01_FULL_40_29]OFZ33892.1 MAG: hypothetical protein A3D17_02580 [Bdellovibrionales bacterium RIFCSPHIGHO2_02_FULL_40_15]